MSTFSASEDDQEFVGVALRPNSRRHSRRLSELIELTEQKEKNDAQVLKPSAFLTIEENNILQTYNQLGNYLDWVENLIEGTKYQRADKQEPPKPSHQESKS